MYLGARHLGGLIKLSMHRSGIWRLAWSHESGLKAQSSEDRVEERWSRPPEFRPGWTQGPSVIAPHSGIDRPFRHNKQDNLDKVLWIPTPTPENKHHFTVLFASPSAPTESWAEVVRPSDRKVGILELRNGGQVVLCQREVAMVDKERSFILQFVKNMRINYDAKIPEVTGASVFSAGTDDAGNPYLLDIALGWENVFGRAGSPAEHARGEP